MRALSIRLCVAGLLCASLFLAGLPAAAVAPGNVYFQRTWERTDQPVSDLAVSRTWMWGPEAFTDEFFEPYAEAHNNGRAVQYYDKSRMEINHNPGVDPDSIWFVTNGLLATELVTGRVQLGDNTFEQWLPAEINVAGDADDPTGPTYRSFRSLLSAGPGIPYDVRSGITRDGDVYFSDAFAAYGIRAEHYASETFHWIARPFWDFMNSSGLVYEGGALTTAPLFVNPYYATGYPITEPAWASVKVGGVQRDVLIQVFERRVLTYTPGNPEGFIVEAGNVGRHYYEWRHVQGPPVETIVYQTWDAGGEFAEIFAMNADGSDVRNLSELPADDWTPALSPDGRRIAFASDRGKQENDFDIWLMDIDGGNLVQLTTSTEQELSPAWSPDGRRIAYIRNVNDDNYEIYLMNADGSDQVNVTERPDAYDASPDWSPNGLQIAFTSVRDGNEGDIFTIYTSGDGIQRLTLDEHYDSMPAWSRDGQRIAFARNLSDEGEWEIYVMNADGTNQKQWTFSDGDDVNPAWSPDGTRLAYVHETSTSNELWLMDEGGLNQRRLGNTDVSVGAFSWGLVPAEQPTEP